MPGKRNYHHYHSRSKMKNTCASVNLSIFLQQAQLAFPEKADIFASSGVLPFSCLKAYTLQDATFSTCSYLHKGNFTVSTFKSRYSHSFNRPKLLRGQRVPQKWKVVRTANSRSRTWFFVKLHNTTIAQGTDLGLYSQKATTNAVMQYRTIISFSTIISFCMDKTIR